MIHQTRYCPIDMNLLFQSISGEQLVKRSNPDDVTIAAFPFVSFLWIQDFAVCAKYSIVHFFFLRYWNGILYGSIDTSVTHNVKNFIGCINALQRKLMLLDLLSLQPIWRLVWDTIKKHNFRASLKCIKPIFAYLSVISESIRFLRSLKHKDKNVNEIL